MTHTLIGAKPILGWRERVKMGTGRQEGVDRDKTCMVCVKPNQSF